MTKRVFLVDLEKALTFMTDEDREAAIAYYSELFDEAGDENEQQVLDELGSATRVAVQLSREYTPEKHIPRGDELAVPGEQSEPESDGKTNTPWKGQLWRTGEIPPWRYGLDDLGTGAAQAQQAKKEPSDSSETETETHAGGEYAYSYVRSESRSRTSQAQSSASWHSPRSENAPPKQEKKSDDSDSGSRRAKEERQSYQENPYAYKAQPVYEKKRLPGWLIALIVVFAIPVGIPAVAVVFSIAVAVLAVLFALVTSGLAIVAAGIGVILSGVWALGFLPDALMLFGIGALLLAIGIAVTWLMLWLSISCVRGLLRRIRRDRGRKA